MTKNSPPMGWNSFDCFGATVTEDEVLANAEFLARHLKPFGWDHVVVDYCWSHPNPPSCTNPNQLPEFQPYLEMDGDFRLLPAPTRFPSAEGNKGFGPLASKIHAMGLKFGIHIMRGLPRQAFYPGYPSVNLRHKAAQMADPEDTCSWLNHMFGVRAEEPAGQDYYNSLFQLYASWGVDFVKADDLSFPYRAREIEAIDLARRHCGRDMLLSLSPGPCPVDQADHVSKHAELWRISADFWDDWSKLKEMFLYCSEWAPHRKTGAWPDADMLPLGKLSKRGPVGPEHESYFTADEQKTMMTLWCLFRSPLFVGGNLPEMKSETLELLQNPEVLAVHNSGSGAYPFGTGAYPDLWISQGKDPCTVHVGFFNLTDEMSGQVISWKEMGWNTPPVSVRDLWQRSQIKPGATGLEVPLPPHGSALYTIQLSEAPVPRRCLEPVELPTAQPAMAASVGI
jgi:hypothetical protein